MLGRVVATVMLLVLVASACTGGGSSDPSSTRDSSTATPGPTSDTGAGGSPDGNQDEPRIVPPLELPATAPGSDEAAAALVDDLERFMTEDQLATGVPWPDLRNADPVAAYEAAAAFQRWMLENNPTPSLVEAYTAPSSPERGWDLAMFEERNTFNLRSGPSSPPYRMRVEDLVHPAATGITDALLATVPEGSAAVVYWDSEGASDIFTADGQFFRTNPGWSEIGPWVAIMAPTNVGWQVWWDELTEPPPPGSRVDQGQPQDQERRPEV